MVPDLPGDFVSVRMHRFAGSQDFSDQFCVVDRLVGTIILLLWTQVSFSASNTLLPSYFSLFFPDFFPFLLSFSAFFHFDIN